MEYYYSIVHMKQIINKIDFTHLTSLLKRYLNNRPYLCLFKQDYLYRPTSVAFIPELKSICMYCFIQKWEKNFLNQW